MRAIIQKFLYSNLFPAYRLINVCRCSNRNDNITITDEKKKQCDDVEKNLLIEKYNNIYTINIDRYETRNSLDIETITELSAAVENFEKDEKAKVLILHGEGGTFCSGFDVDEIEHKGYDMINDAAVRFNRQPFCTKPTIAAVSGYAVAAGFSLALACDIRIIEDTAMLGFLGRRFGVPTAMQGHARITNLVGLSKALDLLITGRLISGTDAFNMGLATKVTSTGTALGEAIKLAKSLTKFPQNALMVDKMLAIRSQLGQDNENSVRDEAIILSMLGNAQEELKMHVKKFHRGIGRHGKFYQLTEVPLKDWELEHTVSEVIVGKSAKDISASDTEMFKEIQIDCSKMKKKKDT